jgi:hypothetical protein
MIQSIVWRFYGRKQCMILWVTLGFWIRNHPPSAKGNFQDVRLNTRTKRTYQVNLQYDYRLTQGANSDIQLSALLSQFAKFGKNIEETYAAK